MPDWTKPMSQTFEYYIVDPGTWKDLKRIDLVRTSSVNRDATAETLGSAAFTVTDMLEECYIRTYLVTVQNGVTERHPLGTHMIQTPTSKFDGRTRTVDIDGYTPLLELKENQPPIGYFIPKDANVMDEAYKLVRDNVRAPVIKPQCESKVSYELVAEPSETWISYISDVISNQIYEDKSIKTGSRITQYFLDVDAMGYIMFSPIQEVGLMQPVWTYTDDNSSILYPEISMNHDIYGIPNVVEVVYSATTANTGTGQTTEYFYVRVENHDPNSPLSIENRGREITHRAYNPTFGGAPTEYMVEEYGIQLIRALSKLQHTVSYTHGYCPVRLNDCVRLNYSRAGLNGINAKVIHQSIKCTPGCPVTEKAVYTEDLLNPKYLVINNEPYDEWLKKFSNGGN